ncbi:unnamed protein product, partial [Closterium sp. NIES-54]
MAAQELRWLTYLLTDLGEQPRSPPVLYVDNKAMLALYREHRLKHRTKHIALRYFLARELQQRGQLRLAYVASEANTADIFTKALARGDHQRFCTLTGLVFLLGSRAFVRDTSADKLSSRAIPSVFLGFPPDAFGWQVYDPTLRRVLPPQDVTFDESVPFYRLFPFRTAPLPHPPLFLAPGPPPVDPLPPQGPAPSGVSQVDPFLGTVPVEVAVDSGAARGAAFGGAATGGAESGGAETASAELGGAEPAGAEPGGAESEGVEFGGVEHGGAEPGGTEPDGAEPGGAESEGAESGGAEPRGIVSAGGPAGASPRLSPWREPLSPQQLREWFAQRTRLMSGATGARGSAAGGTGAGGARATSLGGTGGAGAVGTGRARTRAVYPRAGDPGAGGAGAGGAVSGSTGAGGTVQWRLFFVPPPPSSLPPPESVLRQ